MLSAATKISPHNISQTAAAAPMIGATFVAPLPTDLAPPAPTSVDVTPWSLRDGTVGDAKLMAAAADSDSTVWRSLFAEWARRRGGGAALHTPTWVPAGRSARDALFDMLAIYDVYEARMRDGYFDTMLAVPSAIPSATDITIVLHYDIGGDRAMRLRVIGGARLGSTAVRISVRVDRTGVDGEIEAWDVRGDSVRPAGDDKPAHWLFIDWTDEQPRLRGSTTLAALGHSFRMYAHYARPQRGRTLDDVELSLRLCAGTQYARAIPIPIGTQRGAVDRENLLVALANCESHGANPATIVRARVTALFDTVAGTMRFDDAGCTLHGPATAPVALYLAGNDQWSRSHSPVVCSPLPGATPLELAPNTGAAVPESTQRMRFGHEARVVRRMPVPLTLTDRRAYVAPAPLRPTLGRRRAAWLELHLSELHPDAERMEQRASAYLMVGDFDRVLRAARIDAVYVELVLGWRAGTNGPYNFRTVPVRFQLAHDDAGTYAYAGLPDTVNYERSMMPFAVHIVPSGY